VSVKTGGTHVAISSHTELEKFFENARRRKSKMYISFDNQGVKPSNLSDNRINMITWNDSGQWIGTANLYEDVGWAGGAVTVPKPKPAKRSTANNQNAKKKSPKSIKLKSLLNKMKTGADDPDQDKDNLNDTNSVQEDMHDLNVPEWTSIINTGSPGHNTRAPKKLLIAKKSSFPPEEPGEARGLSKLFPSGAKRSKRDRTHSKNVKFSVPNNEEYFFRTNDAANVRRILMQPKERINQTSQKLSPGQTLINAIRFKSCSDVIRALEPQEYLEAQCLGDLNLEEVLQKEYNLIGNEIKTMNKNAGMIAEKNDLSAKYRVLSIYITCIHLIEKTLSLKKWYALNIELKYIDLQQNHSIVDVLGGNVAIKLHDGNMKEDFGSLPVQKFAQHINYSDPNSGEKLVYTAHNNKSFPFEQRGFIIDLKKGSLQDAVATGRTLGSFNIKLNDIEDKCLSDGNPSEFIKPLSNNNLQEISYGLVTINASKRSADKEYIMLKKQDVMRKMRTQLEYIERFNLDPKTPPGARLTANILGIGGKSILHAAIVLVDDKSLVEKMLRLGANPRCSSNTGIGTPLNLAQRNYHRALEKERNIRRHMEQNKATDADIEPHVQRCNQARMLVEILQKNVIEPPAAVAAAKSSLATPEKCFDETMEDNESQSGTKYLSAKSHPEFSSKTTSTLRQVDSRVGNTNTVPYLQETCVSLALKIPTKKRLDGIEKKDQLLSPPTTQFDPTALPILESPVWVKTSMTRCSKGPSCHFFRLHTCRYVHDALAPLPHHGQPPIASDVIPPSEELLNSNAFAKDAHFLKGTASSVDWYTAAYLEWSSKTVVYVQKVVKSYGRVSKDGVVWFPTKEDALYNLRCTMFLYLKKIRASRLGNSHKHTKKKEK